MFLDSLINQKLEEMRRKAITWTWIKETFKLNCKKHLDFFCFKCDFLLAAALVNKWKKRRRGYCYFQLGLGLHIHSQMKSEHAILWGKKW
jgi:hypothetical protein